MELNIGEIILKKEIDIGELELDVKKIGVKTGEINIDRNGQYDAVFDGFDGYSRVFVNVPEKVLGSIEITANGTYNAKDNNFDGFSEVIVAVADEHYNIFSNDYSQIGYSGGYIKTNGYTPSGILWSDMTKYTGQTSAWYVTNPIPIESNTKYVYTGFGVANNPGCCYLGEDMTTIYEGFVFRGEGVVTTPENAKYIVLSVNRDYIDTMVVKKI